MLDVLAITGPIYIIIGIGFLAGRQGMFSKADLRVLGRFVINLALPALLFRALAERSIAEVLNPVYLAAYAGGSLVVLFGTIAYARFGQKRDLPHAVLVGLGASFSNSGFVGYPIILQFLGPPAAAALALSMIVENLLLFPLIFAMLDSGGQAGDTWQRVALRSLGRVLTNPLILAIGAGFAFALLDIRLPAAVSRTIELFALASTAVALFVIGGSLVGLRVKGMLADASLVAAGKLILHPLAVVAFLLLLPPIDPLLRTAAVTLACMPMLSIYPILAQKHGLEGFCAAALLATTVLSFLTISGALWIMSAVPGWMPAP